ncbi:flagellar hook-basal body complex protein FliE [Thalassococcus lentus]|uniref:Flagellar hook-basal body complex protein FliE n=1 Tax=Thalassococcus lentus TaxID=1210524 RepID=A0ABT4XN10_9RHOB|nr:flagellar hook-basal body complex protein FliE [Thalassococcus lentus]MDA7423325.1 flagellar hook-basal body complex protein FliE [Thalassococcus lentus]
MDVRSLFAAQTYSATKPAVQAIPQAGGPGKSTFAEIARELEATIRGGEQTAQAAMAGRADPHALVEALAQSELAVETVVAVRNKVVEAYQEILRMPV